MGSVGTPPFPGDLPVASLPLISLAKLSADDTAESERLFEACLNHGFFLLGLTESDEGRILLENVKGSFEVGKKFFAEDVQTKEEYKLDANNVG
jgi:isopenicillin N synthase-like dioxygenase